VPSEKPPFDSGHHTGKVVSLVVTQRGDFVLPLVTCTLPERRQTAGQAGHTLYGANYAPYTGLLSSYRADQRLLATDTPTGHVRHLFPSFDSSAYPMDARWPPLRGGPWGDCHVRNDMLAYPYPVLKAFGAGNASPYNCGVRQGGNQR